MLLCLLLPCYLSLHILLHKPSAIQVLCDFTSRDLSDCLHQLKIRCRKTALIGTEGEEKQKGPHASQHFREKCVWMIKNCIPPSFSLAEAFNASTHRSFFNTIPFVKSNIRRLLRLISTALFKWTHLHISTTKASCETPSLNSLEAIGLRFHAGKSTWLKLPTIIFHIALSISLSPEFALLSTELERLKQQMSEHCWAAFRILHYTVKEGNLTERSQQCSPIHSSRQLRCFTKATSFTTIRLTEMASLTH